jgi:thioredoxin reductase
MKLIVIGAGPMGVEAALAAEERGFAVTVLEKGRPGEALHAWGETRLFSPMGMNLSARARRILGEHAPPEDALYTGPELAERVLAPLCARLDVRPRHRVLSVGRARMRRDEFPAHPLRAERPFHLLVETPEGERVFACDRLLDASGVYGQPLPFGAGGVPALGERAFSRVTRHLGALLARLAEKRGRRVLLVGHGYSAAHAVALLADAGAQLTWAVRSPNARPVLEVANDPLPERARVASRANAIAAAPPAHVTLERRAHVEEVDAEGRVRLSGGRLLAVDEIVALTGYRPDLSILSELAVEIGPSTEGAARLERALSSVTDCLSAPSVSAADLASGEPGFSLVGAKSYGRSRAFLLSSGLAQIETLLDPLR